MAPKTVSATVRYSKPGTRPPVYLAGSFSDPAWQAAEMEYTSGEDNEYDFHKEIRIEEGREYQYKFRIGEGDWWVLNEDSPSGTDNAGNRNNLLVAPISKSVPAEKPSETTPEAKSSPPSAKMEADTKSIEEKMGTREPSDVLFDDEIVKESDEHEPLPVIQNSTPPASKNEEVKATVPKKDHLPLLDGADQSSSVEAEPNHTPHEVQQTSKHTAEAAAQKIEDVTKGEAKEKDSPKVEGLAPTLTIKEIDAQDNDSVGATHSDKGSEPGYIMVEDRALTPELASTAAEVADSAAKLDPREPTPPISDEEAGRIGYRRMSTTPIPQVAATAAEVADVAAMLDHDTSLEAARAAFESSLTPEEREYVLSGASTPEHEKVPLFPHEMPTPPGQVEPNESIAKENIPEIRMPSPTDEQDFDLDQPEPFPTDRDGILEHLRLMQERLPEDEGNVDIAPAPCAMIFHRSEYDNSRRQSTVEPVQDSSPELPSEAHFAALDADVEEEARNRGDDLNDLTTLSDIKEASLIEHEELPSPPVTIEPVEPETESAVHTTEGSKKQVKIVEPLVLPGLTPTPVLPNTPFSASDDQMSVVEEIKEPTRAVGSPEINLIPATPADSSVHTTDPMETGDGASGDKAKSTATEDNSVLIRARKQNASPAPDRPLTPSSMRSAGKEAHERNFLQAFWRVVFVDWIGGLILRLCGGSRRQTALLVVSVAVLAAVTYLR